MSPERMNVFVSYSRKDQRYLKQLRTQLSPFERKYDLVVWDDSKIPVGSDWRVVLNHALERAKVGVLLVSPDFLASKFVVDFELPKLLRAAKEDGLVPCIVHVRPSGAHHVDELAALQAVNDPKRPIACLRGVERDAAWLSVAEAIVRNLPLSETSAMLGVRTPPSRSSCRSAVGIDDLRREIRARVKSYIGEFRRGTRGKLYGYSEGGFAARFYERLYSDPSAPAFFYFARPAGSPIFERMSLECLLELSLEATSDSTFSTNARRALSFVDAVRDGSCREHVDTSAMAAISNAFGQLLED